jgi:hypothetical protein
MRSPSCAKHTLTITSHSAVPCTLLFPSFNPGYAEWQFYGFPHFLHSNAKKVSWNMQWPSVFKYLFITHDHINIDTMARCNWNSTIKILMLTLSSSKLNSPYSRRVPLPFVRMPQPDIMVVPLRMFVIVAGNSSAVGLCVVMPTSMLPDHLSTRRSIRICR